jgi:peptidoglycan hydrolase-like protein with peptidoglycan-binding domain
VDDASTRAGWKFTSRTFNSRECARRTLRGQQKVAAPVIGAVLVAVLISGCASTDSPRSADPKATTVTTGSPTAPTTSPTTAPPVVTTTSAPPTTTTTAPPHAPYLMLGSTGPRVLALQQRLVSLGYWLGTPDGVFGDSTQQAVWALQKAARISRDGIVGPVTEAALARGVVPQPRNVPGYVIQVDLQDDLVMFVKNDKLQYVLNTSTGGGYTYNDGDGTAVATTPQGVFNVYRQVDGIVTDSLGQLWRPKFFYSGFAIHGDSYVPPYPASHGCVRVSNEAIDWIWADNLAPIGTTVWVY